MTIPAELWDVIKLLGVAYIAYILQRTDRSQRELFKRIRKLELAHASNHGVCELEDFGD